MQKAETSSPWAAIVVALLALAFIAGIMRSASNTDAVSVAHTQTSEPESRPEPEPSDRDRFRARIREIMMRHSHDNSDDKFLVQILQDKNPDDVEMLRYFAETSASRREKVQKRVADLDQQLEQVKINHPDDKEQIASLGSSLNEANDSLYYGERNLELLTVLRRLEGKPDPLHVFVTGIEPAFPKWPDMPTLHVTLRNIDTLQQTVTFTRSGNNRSGRSARFRIEVRDSNGDLLPPIPPPSFIGGGLYSMTQLEFGQGWHTTLPMEVYVPQLKPGTYKVRVLYHNEFQIDDRDSIDDLICSQSREFELEIPERQVWQTPKEAEEMAKLLAKWSRSGHIQLIGVPYGPNVHDLIPPDSELGVLLAKGWDLVPSLLSELEDESQTVSDRAHTLGLLFSITGQLNPGGSPRVFGRYFPSPEKTAIGPFVFYEAGHGVSYHSDEGGVSGSGSYGFGMTHWVGLPNPHEADNSSEEVPKIEIDREMQDELIAKWRQLRRYISVMDPDGVQRGGGGGLGGAPQTGAGAF